MPIRTLPNNLEAEESVLGACFLSKYALQKASENLTPESFYNEKNSVEWRISCVRSAFCAGQYAQRRRI